MPRSGRRLGGRTRSNILHGNMVDRDRKVVFGPPVLCKFVKPVIERRHEMAPLRDRYLHKCPPIDRPRGRSLSSQQRREAELGGSSRAKTSPFTPQVMRASVSRAGFPPSFQSDEAKAKALRRLRLKTADIGDGKSLPVCSSKPTFKRELIGPIAGIGVVARWPID